MSQQITDPILCPLGAIMAERDEWIESGTGDMAATRGWIAQNGWRHVSPNAAWIALEDAWSSLLVGIGDLVEHDATEPERRAARVARKAHARSGRMRAS